MTFLTRFGIAGGLTAGVFLGVPGILESFTGKATGTSFVIAFAGFFALPLLTALYLNLPRRGRFEDVGYAVSIVGTGLFSAAAFVQDAVLIHLDRAAQQDLLRGSPRIALLTAVAAFILGAVLFGTSLIRAARYPRIPAFAYPVVLTAFAVSATLPYSPYKGIAHAALAAVLIWLALDLAVGSPRYLRAVQQTSPGPVQAGRSAMLGR
jgi:hypothetical protein